MNRPPYLPFKDGPPEFAPGLELIDPEVWLLPDTEADAWLTAKHGLMRSQCSIVFANTGERETLEEVAELVSIHTGSELPQDWPTPLEAAASLVSDDLCVMTRGADAWELAAASLCAPTYWQLGDYIGRPLAGLHRSVDGRDGTLAPRIARIFDMMRAGQIFERFNWTVQIGPKRFTPARPHKADLTPDDLHLRVERQTIRKLPETGAVLFTIRICVDPLGSALVPSEDRAAFAHAWRGASQDVRNYKGWAVLDETVEALLDTADMRH